MKIAVLKESQHQESRVALTPEITKKYCDLGFTVTVQAGAGVLSSFPDRAYQEAGATIEKTVSATLKEADILLKVRAPQVSKTGSELKGLKDGSLVITSFPYEGMGPLIEAFVSHNLSSLALDRIPRITRAQSMDILSSQANLGGYRAVIDAVYEYGRALPMMMTAAGTVRPAKVLIVGAGVAGLQAIATAKRLGAIVSAFDVRAAAKEQVESLGAHFINVDPDCDDAETSGGYAKETSDAYKKRQAEKMAAAVTASDIVITTALIPGKPAPRLITTNMIKTMKPGSVLLDMAVERGGNIEGSKDNHISEINGVKVIGYSNSSGRLPAESSTLYARNLFNLIQLMVDPKTTALTIDLKDDIIKGALMTYKGEIVHPDFKASSPTKKTVLNPKAKAKKEVKK